MATRWRMAVFAGAVAALVALGGCGGDSETAVISPPPGVGFDYQIGGAYPPGPGVAIVTRDRHDAPAKGRYNVCYVNGFQAQTDAEAEWLRDRPTLVLRDDAGTPIKDTEWDELLFDLSTAAKRTALARVVGGWIDGCAAHGYQAVELDNLDSYIRSGGRLTAADALAFARLLVDRAHDDGLAVGQKNAADLVARAERIGFDFAVAEECDRYDECRAYTEAYGQEVFVVEYRRADFAEGCRDWPDLSFVLRDREVSRPSEPGYVHDTC